MTASLKNLPLVVSALTVFCDPVLAGELTPNFSKPGEAVFSESFDGTPLGEDWAVAKGDWKIVDGALRGAERASDKHAAVLTLLRANTDSVVGFRFKLEGPESFSFSLNHAAGHMWRVTAGPDGLVLLKDKDKKDPQSKMEILAEAKGPFEQGKWYSVLVEIAGDKVVVQTDNGLTVSGSHPAFATEKTGYRFVVHGEHLMIDDLKVRAVVN